MHSSAEHNQNNYNNFAPNVSTTASSEYKDAEDISQDVIISTNNVILSQQGKLLIRNIISAINRKNASNKKDKNEIWVVSVEKTQDNKTRMLFGVCDEIDLNCNGYKQKMQIALNPNSIATSNMYASDVNINDDVKQGVHDRDIDQTFDNYITIDNDINHKNMAHTKGDNKLHAKEQKSKVARNIKTSQTTRQQQKTKKFGSKKRIQTKKAIAINVKEEDDSSNYNYDYDSNPLYSNWMDFDAKSEAKEDDNNNYGINIEAELSILDKSKHDLKVCQSILRLLTSITSAALHSKTGDFQMYIDGIINHKTGLNVIMDIIKMNWNRLTTQERYQTAATVRGILLDGIKLLCNLTKSSDICRLKLCNIGIMSVIEMILTHLNQNGNKIYSYRSRYIDCYYGKTHIAVRKLVLRLLRYLCIRVEFRDKCCLKHLNIESRSTSNALQLVDESVVDLVTRDLFVHNNGNSNHNYNLIHPFAKLICTHITSDKFEEIWQSDIISLSHIIIILACMATVTKNDSNHNGNRDSDHDCVMRLITEILGSVFVGVDIDRTILTIQTVHLLNILAINPHSVVTMWYNSVFKRICVIIDRVRRSFDNDISNNINTSKHIWDHFYNDFQVVKKCLQLIETATESIMPLQNDHDSHNSDVALILARYETRIKKIWDQVIKKMLLHYHQRYEDGEFERNIILLDFMNQYASYFVSTICDTLCTLVINVTLITDDIMSTMKEIIDSHVIKHKRLTNNYNRQIKRKKVAIGVHVPWGIPISSRVSAWSAHEKLTLNDKFMKKLFGIFFALRNNEWNNMIRYIWIGFYKNDIKFNKKCYICLLPKDIVKHLIKYVSNAQIDNVIQTWHNTKWYWLTR